MSIAILAPTLVAVAFCLLPVWLLRRASSARTQDYFVSAQATRPEIVRNASIAYALRIVVVGTMFAWGASGELWPALVVSLCFGLGIYGVYLARNAVVGFLDEALIFDRSITVHAFIAKHYGTGSQLQVLAAGLTVFALFALFACEAIGVGIVAKALLPGSSAVAYGVVIGAGVLAMLFSIPAGHSGVMHSCQLALGALYLGLFGSGALLLYLRVSSLAPMSDHATFAASAVVLGSAVLLWIKRSRYVDTDLVRSERQRTRPIATGLARSGKILNIAVSVAIALTLVMAAMALYASGPSAIVRSGTSALGAGMRIPGLEVLALCLLALIYPLIDVTHWQKLAALRKDLGEQERQSTRLRGVFTMYAVEAALLVAVASMIGAITLFNEETSHDTNVAQRFLVGLVAGEDGVAMIVAPLLLMTVVVVALSTMSTLFSAGLCTIRYDWVAASGESAGREATARRRTVAIAIALGLMATIAGCVAEASATSALLGLFLAACCAQLAMAPLVLGAIVAPSGHVPRSMSTGWATLVVGAGLVGGLAALAAYVASGAEAWLWAAIPACLGAGLIALAAGKMASRAAAR